MAKPVVMTIDIEEGYMGRVWRTLDSMPGVIRIHIHGTDHKASQVATHQTGTTKGMRRGGAGTVESLILAALKDAEDMMNRDQLVPVLEAGGKNRNSLPDSITKLKNKKYISLPKQGHYKITAAGRKRLEDTLTQAQEEGK